MLQLGRDTSHVPTGLDYPRGGRLERDQGLEGRSDQLAKQSLAILQVWGHCLTGRESCFKQSDRLAGHVGEGFHPNSDGL